MIHSIAIDDEPKALEVIRSHAGKIDFLSLEQTFTDPFQALKYLEDHAVDLVFLDINMPDIDGLQLRQNFIREPLIIFTTGHSEYALKSYELAAFDYLLKPFDFSRFLLAVTRVKERLQGVAASSEFFFVNTGQQRRRVEYRDIRLIEGEGNYVRYFLNNDKILVRALLRDTLKLLPVSLFVQIHRSYIVSLQYVEKIQDNHVYIAGMEIPIGATYRDNFLRRIDQP